MSLGGEWMSEGSGDKWTALGHVENIGEGKDKNDCEVCKIFQR